MAGRETRKSGQTSPFGVFARKPVEREPAPAQVAPAATGALQPESAQTWPDDAVEVGAMLDAYGLKGWIKLGAHADAGRGGDALLKARRWWLKKGRDLKSAPVTQSKVHGDTIVAHLAGCDDRDTAYALRGHTVFVRRVDFPALDTDEFYWVDLIGLDVVNEAGDALGTVAGMIDNGVHAIMRIEYPSLGKDGSAITEERLIPFVGVYVKAVDQAARRIVVDWQADY